VNFLNLILGDLFMSESNANRRNELSSIARSQFDGEQYDQAEENLRQVLDIALETNEQNLEASTLNNLGLIYKSREQYSEALDLYQQSLTLYRQLDEHVSQAEVLDNTGFVYYSLGQYFEALEAYREALLIYLDLDNLEGKRRILQNMLPTIESFLDDNENPQLSTDMMTLDENENPQIDPSSIMDLRLARPSPRDRIWKP
jgi:tetratricopeptide (TPR) repeat protein